MPEESTLQDDRIDIDLTTPFRPALWIIASPERQRIGERVSLSRDEPFLLGRRVERGGLAIEDRRMSRVHARIAWDGRAESFRVADLESANGTFVNGQRSAVAALDEGTLLRTGSTLLVYTTGRNGDDGEERVSRAAPSDLSILLLGESGTGKEVTARRIHQQSGRGGAFVAVNCAALPKELLASELFGHRRGAFSGARDERLGLFRSAEGGTLFLDEIGDLPLELQPALLRVLQERAVRPVGGERELPVNVRMVAATHEGLRDKIEQGTFRLDLFTRLAQVEVRLRPLREKRHHLPPLIDALALDLGLGEVNVSVDALEVLALAPWKGNVRELQSLLARLRLFDTPPFALDMQFLGREAPELLAPQRAEPSPTSTGRHGQRESITRDQLIEVLARTDGRVAEAASALGTSRTQVYRWLKSFGLQPPQRRE